MTRRNGSAVASDLQLDACAPPVNLRALLATGPMPNPMARITDVHCTVPAANGAARTEAEDEDGEDTLVWSPPQATEVEVDIDVTDLCEAPEPEAARPQAAEPERERASNPGRRLRWAVAGLGLAASALAFVAMRPAAPVRLTAVATMPANLSRPAAALVGPDSVNLVAQLDPQDVLVVEDESEIPQSTGAPERAVLEAGALQRRAKRAMDRGERSQAISLLETALRLDPQAATAAAELSDLYFDQGRFDFAVAYAEDAVKADFSEPAHHIRLGDAYVRTGALDDARAQYRTAARLGSSRAATRLAKLGKPLSRGVVQSRW